MLVTLPVIVKDPEVSQWKDVPPTEDVTVESEPYFLDGPISPRVAILDFDPKTGALRPGVELLAPARGTDPATYRITNPVTAGAPVSADAASVSVFGTVYKAIEMFEEPDALGRKVTWAFGAPQLLVVPRAGEMANAFYERDSHSLQFFFFKPANDGILVYTAHSQDIVAHETTHAILDGLAPDLLNAITPQSLAIHEAVADLGAVLCAFRSRRLSERVLAGNNGSIALSNVFSGIAEQFAGALPQTRDYLRNLLNDKTLNPSAPAENQVDRTEPHELSQVLSGALYKTVLQIYEDLRGPGAAAKLKQLVESAEQAYVEDRLSHASNGDGEASAPMKALFLAGERLKRSLLRGLDYLPPGDATFADLGRAMLAADQASHPDSEGQRAYLRAEFVRRHIVPNANRLRVRTNFEHPAVRALDLDALIESDYIAYNFVDDNRDFLGIPERVTFDVRPRLAVAKLYWHRDGKKETRECLLKVAWTEVEPHPGEDGFPTRRRWTAGVTLAIDWESRRIRGLLSTSRGRAERMDSTRMLQRLQATGLLRLEEAELGPNGRPLRNAIQGQVFEGALRVKNTGRMLHAVGLNV